MPQQLRTAFCSIVLFNNVLNVKYLWSKFKNNLIEDYLKKKIPRVLAENMFLSFFEEKLFQN